MFRGKPLIRRPSRLVSWGVTTSKSPRRDLQVACEAAHLALPEHRHRFCPRKFARPQLLARLVLKEFPRLDHGGFAEALADHPDLARPVEPKAVPHRTLIPAGRGRPSIRPPAGRWRRRMRRRFDRAK